ncbi:MAG: hypothetical protein CMJ33_01920 [Phycisphaerae bacterium]|nr:hypothetical protein [Phycisphaerae bacterium]HAW95406.1 hypothetical protein [Phycisphaerales bacterium]
MGRCLGKAIKYSGATHGSDDEHLSPLRSVVARQCFNGVFCPIEAIRRWANCLTNRPRMSLMRASQVTRDHVQCSRPGMTRTLLINEHILSTGITS